MPATPVLEIGGTHVTAALVDPAAGRVLESTREPLAADAPADGLLSAILGCAGRLGPLPGASWGVAVPGPFDYERGIALFTGVGKFDSLFGTDLAAALRDGLAARPGRVVFLNDAHAFALGEWAAGAAGGHARAVGITLGTGVGSAFLADGALVDRGPDVPPRGHVHLLTVAGGPLEDSVSKRAILRRYARAAGGPQDPRLDVADIAALARRGDRAAHGALDDALLALGGALAPWLTAFGATVLVVGGSIAASWDLIAGPLRTGIHRAAPGSRTAVTRARRPTDAALLGTAWHASDIPPPPGPGPGAA
jgi:glucokinase